jgi:hypothetical protein
MSLCEAADTLVQMIEISGHGVWTSKIKQSAPLHPLNEDLIRRIAGMTDSACTRWSSPDVKGAPIARPRSRAV